MSLSVFGLLISLLLVEVCLRLYQGMMHIPQPWSDRPRFYFQHEDAQTLQDFPYNPQKPASVFRIAVVGDSFSFAPFMQFTDAFPKKLEQMLNLRSGQRRAEVINYGVPAYSTSHEVAKVDQALGEGADLMILQITLNDPELKGPAPIGITDFSRFGGFNPAGLLKSVLKYWHTLAFVLERLHNSKTRREYTEYFLDLFERDKTWKPFEQAIGKIATTTKSRGVPLVAVVFPLFGLPLDESYPFYPIHERLAALLSELQVPHLDLSKVYRGIPLERLQVIPGVDRHPNEIAHRMAAEHLYVWLAQQKLLPEEITIRKAYKKRTQIIKEEPIEPW